MNDKHVNISLDFGGLTLLLIILKLCKVVTFSWWWVFAPIWIPLGIILVVLLIIGLCGLLALLLDR